MSARFYWDEERGCWVAVSRQFEFIESEGETKEDALRELARLLEEILHGDD
jgi:predicted RNase H-like HicB family nuclease